MRTISQKLRSLARKPAVSDWSRDDFEVWEVADDWRTSPVEMFAHMSDDEWGMFLCFVAEALDES